MYSSLYLLSTTVLLYTTYCLQENAVVHQPVLVEYYYYCCFRLNYGTTTVGPDIIIWIRNKKRSLLCAPHPQWSEFKICGSLAANKRQNISAEPVCSSCVQNFIREAYSCRASVFLPGCVCVHPPTMRERRQNLHNIRWCLCFPVRGTVEQQLCLLLQISPTCKKIILQSTLPFPAFGFGNLNFVSPRHRRA